MEDPLDNKQMSSPRSMHEMRNKIHCIRYIMSIHSQVLQSSHRTSIMRDKRVVPNL